MKKLKTLKELFANAYNLEDLNEILGHLEFYKNWKCWVLGLWSYEM